MTNGFLSLAVTGIIVAAGAVLYDPKVARWLAAVIYARALAVESARETWQIARAAGLELGTRAETPAPLQPVALRRGTGA
jgi:hypothetical protein